MPESSRNRPKAAVGKMMRVATLVMCAAFGPTIRESTALFSVETVGQVYNQTNEFVYLEFQPQCRGQD